MSRPAFCYDDGKVTVPRRLRPYDILGVRCGATFAQVKAAFGRVITRRKRQDRAMASLAYHIVTSRVSRYRKIQAAGTPVYEIQRPDHFVIASAGDTSQLLDKVSRNPRVLTDKDEHGRTVLYLAARAGFYDMTKALLENAECADQTQEDGSTPLHAASFYGQHHIVKLLLEYGADPKVKNRWNNTAVDEAATTEIRNDFSIFDDDAISKLEITLLDHGHGLAENVHLIQHDGEIIGKAILRSERALAEDPNTRSMWDHMRSNWITAWHGTRYKHLPSILQHGLLPSGSKIPGGTHIKPPSNHYQLNTTYFGVDEWAHAIFVSPNILYASHDCYSDRVFSEKTQWCVLVKVRVEPGSYKTFPSTVQQTFHPIDGEPEKPEYRVAVPEEHDVFHRVEAARHVVVTSVVFIQVKFLCNISDNTHTFTELNSLFEW